VQQPGLPFDAAQDGPFDHQAAQPTSSARALQAEEPALRIHFVRMRRARRYVMRVRPDGDVRVTIPRGGSKAEAIRFAISHYREQMSEVARRLQIGRSTLYRKLENLGLDGERVDRDTDAVSAG